MTFIDVLFRKLDDPSFRELCLLHLDFAKSFDKVPHGQLIGMLENSGLEAKLMNFFCSRNWNQKLLVLISSQTSDVRAVSGGVYQAAN